MKALPRAWPLGNGLLRKLVLIALCIASALALPASSAGNVVTSSAEPSMAPPAISNGGAGFVTLYAHNDCVGPGLPGTAAPHATHTQNVPGVRAGTVVHFNLAGLTLRGSPGPCPLTAADLGLLPVDMTATYHLTAVCRGNLDAGTVMLDWTLTLVAGNAVTSGFGGSPCSATAGSTFSLDVTIDISDANVAGIVVPATGAETLTIQN